MLLALLILVWLKVGSAIASGAERVSASAWIQGLIVIPLWLLILSLLELPEATLGHRVNLHFGLSVEAWPAWWIDWLKSTVLFLVVGTAVLEGLFAIMRRSPRRWWLWFWLLTLPAEVVVVFAVPLVVDPLFNHFEPLSRSDPALVDQLERVAARGGLQIPPDRIFLMDASRRVTGPNAYVTGLGASKRIVVWDTTLRLEPQDEILFTYGHEQGHYVLHHVAKGIVFSAPILLFFYWIAFLILKPGYRAGRMGADDDALGSWASVGLLLLVAVALNFLAQPLANAISRRIEHQADVYGQEVIHGIVRDPGQTATRSFCRDAQLWLDTPSPNRFVEFWTYTHPSTEERAEFAANYDPWLSGHHPQYVKGP